MKTLDYHNPLNVDPSNLKPGERFLLKEEVGANYIKGSCNAWMIGSQTYQIPPKN